MTAQTAQKPPRGYRMHGDCYRIRRLKDAGMDAIDGRTRAGKEARAWRAEALLNHGGEACSRRIREAINGTTFILWRMLCLRDYIAQDAHKRGTPVNRRNGRLPKIHEQYDLLAARFDAKKAELDKAKSPPNPFTLGGGL